MSQRSSSTHKTTQPERGLLSLSIPEMKDKKQLTLIFKPGNLHRKAPYISIIHTPFDDWFDEKVEGPLSACTCMYTNQVESCSARKLVAEYGAASSMQLRWVYFLLKERPSVFLLRKPNVFFVADYKGELREVWFIRQFKGWAIKPKILGKEVIPEGSRFFWKNSS